MRTVSIGIENLCVTCACRCAYCLLSYDGRPVGVEYGRGLPGASWRSLQRRGRRCGHFPTSAAPWTRRSFWTT